eukprot:GSChrysophyteH2.ASY1.ANO1.323.1 assembled CDS
MRRGWYSSVILSKLTLAPTSSNSLPFLSAAHRGAGTVAPENTLMGFDCGKQMGYSAVEFDVMLSSDKLPFLIHDEDLGRTVVGSGRACELTRAELCALDAAKWHPSKGTAPAASGHSWDQSGQVPAFEDVLAYCHLNNIWMNVEIKPAKGFEADTGTVVAQYTEKAFQSELAELDRLAMAKLPLISSFYYESLVAAKAAAPKLPRAFLIDDLNSEVSKDWRTQLEEIDAVAVHTNHEYLTKELAEEIKSKGYALFCYTVDTVEDYDKLKAWGVDSVCTDALNNPHNLALAAEGPLFSLFSPPAALPAAVDTPFMDVDTPMVSVQA